MSGRRPMGLQLRVRLDALLEPVDQDQAQHEYRHHRDQQREHGRTDQLLAAEHEEDFPYHGDQPDDDERLGHQPVRAQREHHRVHDLDQDQHQQYLVQQAGGRVDDGPRGQDPGLRQRVDEVRYAGDQQDRGQDDEDDADDHPDDVLGGLEPAHGPGDTPDTGARAAAGALE